MHLATASGVFSIGLGAERLSEVRDRFSELSAYVNDELLNCETQVAFVMLRATVTDQSCHASACVELQTLESLLTKELKVFKKKMKQISIKFQKSWKYYIPHMSLAHPKHVCLLEQRMIDLPVLEEPRIHGMCENDQWLFLTDHATESIIGLEKRKLEEESSKRQNFNAQPLKEPGGLCLAYEGEYLCLTTQRQYLSVVKLHSKERVQHIRLMDKPHSYPRSCVFEMSTGSIVLAFHGDKKLYVVRKTEGEEPYGKVTTLRSKKSIFRFCCNKNVKDLFLSTFIDQTCALLDEDFKKIVAFSPPSEWQPQFCAMTDDGLCFVVDYIGSCVYCFNLTGSTCKVVAQNLRPRVFHLCSIPRSKSEVGGKGRTKFIDLLYQNTTDSTWGTQFCCVRLIRRETRVNCDSKHAETIKCTQTKKKQLILSHHKRLTNEQNRLANDQKGVWSTSATSVGASPAEGRVFSFDSQNENMKMTLVLKSESSFGFEYRRVERIEKHGKRLLEGMCFVQKANALVYAFNRGQVCACKLGSDSSTEAVICVRQQSAPLSAAALAETSSGCLFLSYNQTRELIKLRLRSGNSLKLSASRKYKLPKCIRTFSCAQIGKEIQFVFIFMDCSVMLSDGKFKQWHTVEKCDDWLPDKCAISKHDFVLISCDILRKIFLVDLKTKKWCIVCRNVRVSAWTFVRLAEQVQEEERGKAQTEVLLFHNYHWNEPRTWCTESIEIIRRSEITDTLCSKPTSFTGGQSDASSSFRLENGMLLCTRRNSRGSEDVRVVHVKNPAGNSCFTIDSNSAACVLCEGGTLLIYHSDPNRNIDVLQLDENFADDSIKTVETSGEDLVVHFISGSFFSFNRRTLASHDSFEDQAMTLSLSHLCLEAQTPSEHESNATS